jgi:hypothetical protein
MFRARPTSAWGALWIGLALAGCAAEATGPNRPPTAEAGPDVRIRLGQSATLDGRGSRDPDGDPLEFRWRLVFGPGGGFPVLNPVEARFSFVPERAGVHLVALEVRDPTLRDLGRWSLPDVAQVRVLGTACHRDEDCGEPADPCSPFACRAGQCQLEPLPDGAPCGPSGCQGLVWGAPACQAGACGARVELEDCDDGQACTQDACDPLAGCSHESAPAGTACGQCAACDALGACLADLDRHQDCPACQRCEGVGRCVNQPAGQDLLGACDNGLFCDGLERCDGQGGCQSGAPPCPAAACDEDEDRCSCERDEDCSVCQRCELEVCLPQAEGDDLRDDCPEGACLTGTCDGQGACGRLARGTACPDDGVFCNGPEACDDFGACLSMGDPCPGSACRTCQEDPPGCVAPPGTPCAPDGVACTLDACDGAGECAHPPDDDLCEVLGLGAVCRPECAEEPTDGCVLPPAGLALECQPTQLRPDQSSQCTARLQPEALEGCLVCEGFVGPLLVDRTDFGDGLGTCELNGWRLVTGNRCENAVAGDCGPAAADRACCAELGSLCVRTPGGGFHLRSDRRLNCGGGGFEEWRLEKDLDTRGLHQLEVCFWAADVGANHDEALGLRVSDPDGTDSAVVACLHDGPRPGANGAWFPVCAPLPAWAAGRERIRLTFVAHSENDDQQVWLDEVSVVGWTAPCEPDRVTAFEEKFEDCPVPSADWNGWSLAVAGVAVDTSVCRANACANGSTGLQASNNRVTLERRLDLTGLDGDVRLCLKVGDNRANAGEAVRVEIDPGGGFQEVWSATENLGADNTCAEVCFGLTDRWPELARHPDAGLRLVLESNTGNEQVFVDDVRVDGARYCPAAGALSLSDPTGGPGSLAFTAVAAAGNSLGGLLACAWGEPEDGLRVGVNLDFVRPVSPFEGFAHRRRVSFDNLGRAEALTDFPVLVVLEADRIEYAACQAGGADLMFVDSDERTVLPHEIERWVPGGTSVVWVRVPRIPAHTDSDFIWMAYGSARTVTTQNRAGVWDRAFVGVWHLAETAGTRAVDSSASRLDGVYTSGPSLNQTGPVLDGAVGFDGNDDRVVLGLVDIPPLAGQDGLTLEAVARKANQGPQDGRLVSKANGSNDENHWWMLSTLAPSAGDASFRLRLRLKLDGSTQTFATDAEPVVADTWFHVAATYDGQAVRIYHDGGLVQTWPAQGAVSLDGAIQAAIGSNPNNYGTWGGSIADVRISRVARSAAWLSAAHQAWFHGPRPFVRIGPREDLPP